MATLEEFFSRYGNVRAVALRYKNRDDCALVSFVDAAAAEAAMKSPQAILDNRFIRVRFSHHHGPSYFFVVCAGIVVQSGQDGSHAASDVDAEAGATYRAGEESDNGGEYHEERRRDAATERTHERVAE